MKTVTVDDIMALPPCKAYTRKRVTKLWAGRKGLSFLEICDLRIPPNDIVWALCKVLPPKILEPVPTTCPRCGGTGKIADPAKASPSTEGLQKS